MKYTRLLAKSVRDEAHPDGHSTLRGHTACVFEAAKRLLRLRLAAALSAKGLPSSLAPRLERIVLVAAFLHDLCKASDHFQAKVRGARHAQLVRHEALLPFLVWDGTTLGDWISPALDRSSDLMLAVLAACGHHRKFIKDALSLDETDAPSKLTVLCTHPDFTSVLAFGAKQLALPTAPPLEDLVIEDSRRKPLRYGLSPFQDAFEDREPIPVEDRELLTIAKAFVIAADVAGSAIPRSTEGFDWIDAALEQRADGTMLESIVQKRLGGKPLRPFQSAVASSTASWTFVRAGCGSGKTAAAYAWAARHHGGRQIWFCYPTTGTATEGYRDYLHTADVEGLLEHGRAQVDFELLDLHDDGADGRTVDRLEALKTWRAEVISCTVDTALGLIQNQRKGLYAFPSLVDSAIVFDEIHAYDDKLFGALLRFLEALPGIPVLLMTASLPTSRHQALDLLCRKVHGQPLTEIDGPPDLETLPRYARLDADEGQAIAEVEAALARGEKVLWVNNTVGLTLQRAARLAHLEPIVYHSHFRYADRVDRHAKLIARFAAPGPVLALTTQVAEMSLDLSADLLVSDLAPVSALIQRLGRLNRRAQPGDANHRTRPFIILPFEGLPYEADDLGEARGWLEAMGMGALSQRTLAEAWRPEVKALPLTASAWLDQAFRTEPADLREGGATVTVLLAEDAPAVRKDLPQAVKYALPMGFPPGGVKTLARYTRVAHLPVVPASDLSYDSLRGGEWTRTKNNPS